ncbi:bile acid-CoA:amino acid N-acyltransferase isoform X2 [Aplysia californica]|nr:bile acid-CoA:amino acid N-acyltransferase isoform X2 [Aplysia californica]
MEKLKLQVSATNALIDDKVRIVVSGLKEEQEITLQTFTKDDAYTYGALGHYRADSRGLVDTFVSHCHGGTFTGVEPMGLFWSMKTLNSDSPGRMLRQAKLDSPYCVSVALNHGFQKFQDIQWSTELSGIDTCQIHRHYVAQNVRRIPIEENGIFGTLFLPPGDGPFPTVVDTFGIGLFMENRSALLASRGFASFALAHSNYKGLPKDEKSVDFNYFLKAFDWLLTQPFVNPDAVGCVANCSGAGYFSLLASRRPQVKCMVLINSVWFPIGHDQEVEGEMVNSILFLIHRFRLVKPSFLSFREMFHPSDNVTLSEGWRHGAKILYLRGDNDECIDPKYAAFHEAKIPAQFRNNLTFVNYPGAGHMLDPPYTPVYTHDPAGLFGLHMYWGGQPKPHADAQEDAWRRLLSFLETHLCKTSPSVQLNSQL